jgi:hypothetical protein
MLCYDCTKAQQELNKAKEDFLPDSLSGTAGYSITVSGYQCFSSSGFSINVRSGCDGYVAEWKKSYGRFTCKTDGVREGKVLLSKSQLSALNEFEHRFSKPYPHVQDYCRGATIVRFELGPIQKVLQQCGCAPDAKSALLSIIFSPGKNPEQPYTF